MVKKLKKKHFRELVGRGKEIEKKEKGGLEKVPFVNYTLDEDKKKKGFVTISLKLNLDEQVQLVKDKKIIQQTKDSTAIKQLMRIGSKVVHEPKVSEYLDIVLENKRKNKGIVIVDFD